MPFVKVRYLLVAVQSIVGRQSLAEALLGAPKGGKKRKLSKLEGIALHKVELLYLDIS